MRQLERKPALITGQMPRRFWVYTAGRDDPHAEERTAKCEARRRWWRENGPGLLALSVVVLLAVLTVLMMIAEFRGYYLDQLLTL